MADIFISYKSERRAAARHLAETLKRHGYSVWFDHVLVKGTDYSLQIQTEIAAAKAVVVLWCTKSVVSGPVLAEADYAKEKCKLVPTMIEACELPIFHRLVEYTQLTTWDGAPRSHVLDPLLDAVAALVGRDRAPDFRALQSYEATWRGFGAPTLRQFALEAVAQPESMIELVQATAAALRTVPPVSAPTPRPPADTRINLPGVIAHGVTDNRFTPGNGKTQWFMDIAGGPQMAVVPTGQYWMGSPETEEGHRPDEAQRLITITKPFAIGRFAVTFDEWDAYVYKGKRNMFAKSDRYSPLANFGRGLEPIINVSHDDTEPFLAWLNENAGKPVYRLPSEAEWEYACRAQSVPTDATTPFWWGKSVSVTQANYDGNHRYAGSARGECRQRTVPVESFTANPWGLFQVLGNVWEWCSDVWSDSPALGPSDGTASDAGNSGRRVLRGGSWSNLPRYLRAANREVYPTNYRSHDRGFRVARDLP